MNKSEYDGAGNEAPELLSDTSLVEHYNDRELSWLSFNYRVLQEAQDPRVPLFERIRFLAIYSSNLDEFFRVRVASLRALLRLGKKSRKKLDVDPEVLLDAIHRVIYRQQEEFGEVYREQIIPELAQHGVVVTNEHQASDTQKKFVNEWFEENVLPKLNASLIGDAGGGPFLRNRRLYLVVQLRPRLERHLHFEDEENEPEKEETGLPLAIVEIPSEELPRFCELPSPEGEHHIIYLDDILRICLGRIFPGFDPVGAWSVKLTRDAELYIDDEFTGNLAKKIKKGLRKRETGLPSRFLYDQHMPDDVLKQLMKALDIGKEDLMEGGRYHNFNDFFGFPFPSMPELEYHALPPHPHRELERSASIFDAIRRDDQILHFPYQSYDYVIRFLEESANDERVESIAITLYRVASNSSVTQSLIEAAQNGKSVTAFVELKARFDEESNIYWAGEMEKAGVKVLYSFPGLKVHSKLCLVKRREEEGLRLYGYLATGNFNEKTARIYTDHALLTIDERITEEMDRVFQVLSEEIEEPEFDHLLVAPFTLRSRLVEMVDREIEHARSGKPASIFLKMNSLEDRKMIDKLYEASQAGVQIELIVRGICCLKPGVKGLSDNIRAISIVDRFLEHARIFRFHNDGSEEWFVASADWMKRNLSRRVEVAFPIYSESVREELRKILQLQSTDTMRARYMNDGQENVYRHALSDEHPPVRAQLEIYNLLKEQESEEV